MVVGREGSDLQRQEDDGFTEISRDGCCTRSFADEARASFSPGDRVLLVDDWIETEVKWRPRMRSLRRWAQNL
jgi:hypothetical protein